MLDPHPLSSNPPLPLIEKAAAFWRPGHEEASKNGERHRDLPRVNFVHPAVRLKEKRNVRTNPSKKKIFRHLYHIKHISSAP